MSKGGKGVGRMRNAPWFDLEEVTKRSVGCLLLLRMQKMGMPHGIGMRGPDQVC